MRRVALPKMLFETKKKISKGKVKEKKIKIKYASSLSKAINFRINKINKET